MERLGAAAQRLEARHRAPELPSAVHAQPNSPRVDHGTATSPPRNAASEDLGRRLEQPAEPSILEACLLPAECWQQEDQQDFGVLRCMLRPLLRGAPPRLYCCVPAVDACGRARLPATQLSVTANREACPPLKGRGPPQHGDQQEEDVVLAPAPELGLVCDRPEGGANSPGPHWQVNNALPGQWPLPAERASAPSTPLLHKPCVCFRKYSTRAIFHYHKKICSPLHSI